jgi:hypothetical protein
LHVIQVHHSWKTLYKFMYKWTHNRMQVHSFDNHNSRFTGFWQKKHTHNSQEYTLLPRYPYSSTDLGWRSVNQQSSTSTAPTVW